MPKPIFKNKGATFVSVAADRKNLLPPLCQILKALCCWVYRHLLETGITPALGTIQIMVGVFNIGLGPGRTSLNSGDFGSLGAAYWLGAVFIVTGIMSILAGQYPSSCLVGFTVFMDIVGAIFAITAVALYAVDLSNKPLLGLCDQLNDTDLRSDNCRNLAIFGQGLLTSVDTTMISMAVIQLFVSIRVAFLGIKALVNEIMKDDEEREMSDTVVNYGVEDKSCKAQPRSKRQKDKLLLQTDVMSVLGAIMILIGLINIGLAPGRTTDKDFPNSHKAPYRDYDFFASGTAYWLGAVFMLAGVMSLLCCHIQSWFLVSLTVFVNIIGSIVAVAAIVIYVFDMENSLVVFGCFTNTDENAWFQFDCHVLFPVVKRLLVGMDITLIVMAVLQMCGCISITVLVIGAVYKSLALKEEKSKKRKRKRKRTRV